MGDFGIDDVIEVFIKVFFSLHSFDSGPADVKTYIAPKFWYMQAFMMIADVILHPDHRFEYWAIFTHCKVWGLEPTSLHCPTQANLSVSLNENLVSGK